jgi:hypothetical protein
MTNDDIIRMAKEAGFDKNSLGTTFTHGKLDESLERFAELVAAAEREACAQIAYDYTVKVSLPNFFESAEYVAAAIRARGQE